MGYRPLFSGGGPGVAPPEGKLHWPPRLAVFYCEGDGQDEQQGTKKNTNMKTNTTNKTERKALGQSEQFTAPTGVSKYIVIQWQGKEQVVVTNFFLIVRMAKLASQDFLGFGHTGIAFCCRIAAL